MTVSPVSSSPPRRSPLPLALALAFAGMPAAWAQSEAVPPGGAVLAPVIVLDTKEQAARRLRRSARRNSPRCAPPLPTRQASCARYRA